MNILQASCYYGAEAILLYLRDLFDKDIDRKNELVSYKEPFGGNMAIHFAVLNGNFRIIDSLLKDFNASLLSLTDNGLSILHCAAQFERGVYVLEQFSSPKYELAVEQRDKFDCTPLLFAVLSL